MDLAKLVNVFNDAREAFEARWDGVDYRITKEPVQVNLGVFQHWQKIYPDAKIRYEEISAEEIAKRQPKNPLESNERGEAFAGLKRPRRKASGE